MRRKKQITWASPGERRAEVVQKRTELMKLPAYIPEPELSPPDRWDKITVGSAVRFKVPLTPNEVPGRPLRMLQLSYVDSSSAPVLGIYMGVTPVKMRKLTTAEVVERLYRTFFFDGKVCLLHDPNLVEAL
jgi:hypothetical protein